MFGEEFLESADSEGQTTPLVERPETSDSTSVVWEARGNLSVAVFNKQPLKPVLDSCIATKHFLTKLY